MGRSRVEQKETLFGAREHQMQCADDVLLICMLEICMVLGTDMTPINQIENNYFQGVLC